MKQLTISNTSKEHSNINTSAYMYIWYSAKHTIMDCTSQMYSEKHTYRILNLSVNIKTIVNE